MSNWKADLVIEGEETWGGTGDSPDNALCDLLHDLCEGWKKDGLMLTGDLISRIGEALEHYEGASENDRFETTATDMIWPFKLIVDEVAE